MNFLLVANRKGRTSRWGLSSRIPRADKGEGIKNLLAVQIAFDCIIDCIKLALMALILDCRIHDRLHQMALQIAWSWH
jgi:hypothetical protein